MKDLCLVDIFAGSHPVKSHHFSTIIELHYTAGVFKPTQNFFCQGKADFGSQAKIWALQKKLFDKLSLSLLGLGPVNLAIIYIICLLLTRFKNKPLKKFNGA